MDPPYYPDDNNMNSYYHGDNYKDVLIEEEDSPYVQDTTPAATSFYDELNLQLYINYLVEFIATYGWLLLFGGISAVYLGSVLWERYKHLWESRAEMKDDEDSDKVLARMEAIQRARDAQQRRLEAASARAREQKEEAEQRLREEARERQQKYGTAAKRRFGDDYNPLSDGGSTSSYRPPKRSACGGGGCGR